MKNRYIYISILQSIAAFLLSFSANAFACMPADTLRDPFLTLERVYELTEQNHPFLNRNDIIGNNLEFELLKADWGYIPTMILSGKASYQTEIISFPEEMAALVGIDPLSKDQYQAVFDFNQMIWDGGDARLKRKVAESDAEVKREELRTDLYSLREKVNELYFSILLVESSIRQMELYRERLQINLNNLDSCFAAGIVSKVDLDQVRVSMIEVEQKTEELVATEKKLRKGISVLVGYDIGDVDLH